MSKRFQTTFIVKELFTVAEITKEAVVYASVKELVNTDADEVHHGSLNQSKQSFDRFCTYC